MTTPPMRPTFALCVPAPPDDVLQTIKHAMGRDDCPCMGQTSGRHVTLMIKPTDRHFWSPWLGIDLTEHNGRSFVHGRFSPHPHVWTGFTAIYGTLVCGSLFAGFFGISQLMLDQPAPVLWILPITGVLAALLYTLSLVGQRLAHEQMAMLRAFLDETLGAHEPITIHTQASVADIMAQKTPSPAAD